MITFGRKSYGRIFVEKEEDIQVVKNIIKEMDEYEFEYLPDDLIAVFDPNIKSFPDNDPKDHLWVDLAYTHKFDSLNLNELQFRCWHAGVKVFCVLGGCKDYECYQL